MNDQTAYEKYVHNSGVNFVQRSSSVDKRKNGEKIQLRGQHIKVNESTDLSVLIRE